MKITMISKEDVDVLKAAKKVLKKLQRKEIKLDAAEDNAITDPFSAPNFSDVALPHWRFLDELEFLGIKVTTDNEISLVCPAPKK